MSINSVTIAGNITRDPEMKTTAGGFAIMNFSVAVNERVKNSQTDEWEDKPGFFDCVMFGKRAESLSRFLSKGMKVTVQGKLRWSQWETQEGQKRSKVEIIADEVAFMSPRQAEAQPANVGGYMEDDDLPFF